MNKNLINEKGIALIMVLWVVILLGVIVNTFAWMVRTEAQAVGNFKEETRAYYLARGGFQQTILKLLKSQESTVHEPLKEGLKLDGRVNMIHFIDGYAEVRVMDEGGKIDINVASRDDIIRVITALGFDVEDKDVIADSILDWIDENNFHRLNGAEDDYYRSLPEPYRAKNEPLNTVDELLWVRGITPKIFYNQVVSRSPEWGEMETEALSESNGNISIEDRKFRTGLESVFTVFTGSNKININTAPISLLLSLPGVGEAQIERIIAVREERPFRDMSDLIGTVAFPPENGKFISFSPSEIYTIEVTGKLNGSHVRRSFKSVVKVKGKTDYDILYWKEG
ncbi:MAG: general secretion pathway protein GspK [Nitrospinae bacterium]|nr:general secretion pathway protein GspK [Nitrospinota bacterium]